MAESLSRAVEEEGCVSFFSLYGRCSFLFLFFICLLVKSVYSLFLSHCLVCAGQGSSYYDKYFPIWPMRTGIFHPKVPCLAAVEVGMEVVLVCTSESGPGPLQGHGQGHGQDRFGPLHSLFVARVAILPWMLPPSKEIVPSERAGRPCCPNVRGVPS